MPQGWSVCATAATGPPVRARKASCRPIPKAAGQLTASLLSGETGRLSTSAARRPTTAGSVIVIGAGGRLACGFPLASSLIVTTRAAFGTRSPGGRDGCQATSASSRIAVWPVPAPAASTTSSVLVSTPAAGRSNSRSQDGGPKSASPRVNPLPVRRACSQDSRLCGSPGASQKAAWSTIEFDTRLDWGCCSQPSGRSGGPARRRAPGGGTKSARTAAAAASARCLVLWPAVEDGAGADGDAGRADTPVLVLVTTAAVIVEVAQPAVTAAASRIRPKPRFTPFWTPHGACRFPEPTAGFLAGLREGHGTGASDATASI